MHCILGEISAVDEWMIGFTGLMALASFGAMVVMIVALNIKQRVRVDTPLEIQAVDRYVIKSEFNAHTARTAHELHEIREILRREIPEMERRLAASGEKRVNVLHERIAEILAGLARLNGIVGKQL